MLQLISDFRSKFFFIFISILLFYSKFHLCTGLLICDNLLFQIIKDLTFSWCSLYSFSSLIFHDLLKVLNNNLHGSKAQG